MLSFNSHQVEKIIDKLVIVGLLTGLVTVLMKGNQLAATAFVDPNSAEVLKLSTSYKLIKVTELFCIFGAGLLSYGTANRLSVSAPARILMWILFLWSLWQAVVAFKNGFSPAEPLGTKGPVVWWSLIFLFAGISKRRWKIIYPTIVWVVLVASIDMVLGIFSLAGDFNRYNAVNTLRITLRLLLWSAPLIFLIPKKKISRSILDLIPLGLIGVGALMTATRSWVIIFIVYSVLFLYRYLKTMTSAVKRVVTVYGIILLFCITSFAAYSVFDSQLFLATDILANRAGQDSRTWQLQRFFQRVPIYDLVIGTGPRGTWRMDDWGPNANYGYVDGPYLLMLFIGGIPLLVSYVYLVVYPFFRACIRKKYLFIDGYDRACITLGMFWALALTGFATFTFPGLYVSHYILLLCAGRCWGVLHEAQAKHKGQFPGK